MLKKSLGISKIENIAKIEVDYPINDFCYAGGYGFVVTSTESHIAYVIGRDGQFMPPYYGTPGEKLMPLSKAESRYASGLSYPSSICWDKDHVIVTEDGGRFLSKIDLNVELWPISVMQTALQDRNEMDDMLARFPERPIAAIDIYGEDVYWTIDSLNACFNIRRCHTKKMFGTKPGYTSASNAWSSCFNHPRGIFYDAPTFFFSDTKNHCVRSIQGNSIKIICGHPNRKGNEDGEHGSLDSPSKLRGNSSQLYCIDSNSVKSISRSNGYLGTILTPNKLISIDVDRGSGDLYILEAI